MSEPVPTSTPTGPSWRTLGVLVGVAVVIWVADWSAKQWVLANLEPGTPTPVIGDLLQFRLVFNPGAAFSLASGSTWIFTILATAVVIYILVQARRIRSMGWAIVLGVLLGGVAGNLFDRIFRDPGIFVGHVVDFIQVYAFPAIFNVADMAICVSMAVFMILIFRGVGLDGVRRTDERDAERDEALPADRADEAQGS